MSKIDLSMLEYLEDNPRVEMVPDLDCVIVINLR